MDTHAHSTHASAHTQAHTRTHTHTIIHGKKLIGQTRVMLVNIEA